jgi:polar amino acid transport system substrate-binding protein
MISETPFARQLHILEINSGQDCMIGMFKKPEREVFAKFTKLVYQDQPQVILSAASNEHRFSKFASVTDLFKDKNIVLLVKRGYA